MANYYLVIDHKEGAHEIVCALPEFTKEQYNIVVKAKDNSNILTEEEQGVIEWLDTLADAPRNLSWDVVEHSDELVSGLLEFDFD